MLRSTNDEKSSWEPKSPTHHTHRVSETRRPDIPCDGTSAELDCVSAAYVVDQHPTCRTPISVTPGIHPGNPGATAATAIKPSDSRSVIARMWLLQSSGKGFHPKLCFLEPVVEKIHIRGGCY